MIGPFDLLKGGGLAQSGNCYSVLEGDILLEEGETYILFAYAQSDGSLIVCGANSAIPYSAEELERVETAAMHPTLFNRDRYISIYDANAVR